MAAQQDQLASQLRDIKPLVPISDWSIYLYWGLITLAAIVILFGVYILYRQLKKLRKTNHRKQHLSALKRIDWNDTKQSAYEATRLGRLILGDEERLHELYLQMTSELEAHKYKKSVNPLSSDAKAQFDLFIKACDESV